MPKMLFRPGLGPGPHWGSLQRSPRPPSWFSGVLVEGLREGEGRGKKGEEKERRMRWEGK